MNTSMVESKLSDILSQIEEPVLKERIKDFFVKDLLEYVEFVEELDRRINSNTEYYSSFEKELTEANKNILIKANALEKEINNKKLNKQVKEIFRIFVKNWICKSLIVERAYEKPRGYPGDYKIIEMVYDNSPITEEYTGRCFDESFLKNPYAIAVRDRKDKLKEIIIDYINNSGLNNIKVLNIACGSCRELVEMLPVIKEKTVVFNCFDWDEEALDFSRSAVKGFSDSIIFNFIKKDLLEFIEDKEILASIGRQNLIYSIGLVDYLPDRVFKKMVSNLFDMVERNGHLIISHKNKEETFPPLAPDWFCDWKFFPRSKTEVIEILSASEIKNYDLDIKVDNNNYIYYFTLTKK